MVIIFIIVKLFLDGSGFIVIIEYKLILYMYVKKKNKFK